MERLRGAHVVVVLGPTASGKTALAVRLAKKFNGEVISADSRQVYRGMDIGTGKDLSAYGRVVHHMIDVSSPRKQFTLADWLSRTRHTIDRLHRDGKLPIVCGGTGLYITALVDGYQLPATKSTGLSQSKLRSLLGRKTLVQLLAELKKVDPATFKKIDANNRRRVERALEIYYQTGLPKSSAVGVKKPSYDFILLGLTHSRDALRTRISKRLRARLRQGMVREVKSLHQNGVSWRRLESFGLEYRYVSRYLRNQIIYEEMVRLLDAAIYQYSRRQMTWFKRDKRIAWVTSYSGAESKVKKLIAN